MARQFHGVQVIHLPRNLHDSCEHSITGRSDKVDGTYCPPDGRLPDAEKGPQHIRDIFYRMGFNDREIVALLGAHGKQPPYHCEPATNIPPVL